jgi:hypothetical protein
VGVHKGGTHSERNRADPASLPGSLPDSASHDVLALAYEKLAREALPPGRSLATWVPAPDSLAKKRRAFERTSPTSTRAASGFRSSRAPLRPALVHRTSAPSASASVSRKPPPPPGPNTSRFIEHGLFNQASDPPEKRTSTELPGDEAATWLAYEAEQQAEQQRQADARRILGLQKEVDRLKKEVNLLRTTSRYTPLFCSSVMPGR